MYINRNIFMAIVAVAVASVVTLAAQQQGGGQPPAPAVRANPTPGCMSTPAEEEAAMQLVMNPQGNPNDRIDPSYKQHNPAFIKAAREMGMTDYAYFMQAFGARGRGQGGGGRQGGGQGGGQAAAAQPPGPNNGNEIVVVQCDIVIQIHMNWRPDPTAPGQFFQAYTFDAWRVRGNKIVEHWDSAVINAPAAAPAGAPAGGAPAGGRGN